MILQRGFDKRKLEHMILSIDNREPELTPESAKKKAPRKMLAQSMDISNEMRKVGSGSDYNEDVKSIASNFNSKEFINNTSALNIMPIQTKH